MSEHFKVQVQNKKKFHHEYGRNITGMDGDANQGGKRKDGRKGSRKVRSLVKK